MRKNLAYKITAVVLALILWAFVMSKNSIMVSETVPVVFTDIPAGLAVNPDHSVTSVSVSFDGHVRFIKGLDTSEIIVPLSLKNAKAGERLYPIDEDSVNLPFPLRLHNVSPLALKVVLERVITRRIPVRVALEGSPAKGYAVTDVSVYPDRVEATGISSAVRELSVLTAEPIDVANAASSIDVESPISPLDKGVSLGSDKIRVKVTIQKK